jgi:hypothetical protein
MSSIWQSSVEMTDTWQATLIVAVGGALHEWQISASTSPIALSVRDGCLLPIERVHECSGACSQKRILCMVAAASICHTMNLQLCQGEGGGGRN